MRASSRDGQNIVTPAGPRHCPHQHSSSTLILSSQWPHKRLFKHEVYSQVIFTDTSLPPLQFSWWRQSLDMHRFSSGYEPRYWFTNRQARWSEVRLSSSRSTRISRKVHHIFKCGEFSSKNRDHSLDLAAPHRHSSSSSGLLKREDCFTIPRAEQARRPLSRYYARSTVRVRNQTTLPRSKVVLVPLSLSQCTRETSYVCFHAIISKVSSFNATFTVHIKNVTRLFLCKHTQRQF